MKFDSPLAFVKSVAEGMAPVKRVVGAGHGATQLGDKRPLFPGADLFWLASHPNPDFHVRLEHFANWPQIITDAKHKFDVVLSVDHLEHVLDVPQAMTNCRYLLKKRGGLMIICAASEPIEPHDAATGGPLPEGQFYRNITRPLLEQWLEGFSFAYINPGERYVYALAGT